MTTLSDGDVILIPVFNDWVSLGVLLRDLDRELARGARRASVLVVDDSSIVPVPANLVDEPLEAISRVDVLRVTRNLGHQRAIAIGLSYIAARRNHNAVVVMDGDGEDLPSDVPRLLEEMERLHNSAVIFAKRIRRSNGPVFALFYWLYRMVHRVLTGIPVRIGNFSAAPVEAVRQLVVSSDLWNHYAAAVIHGRIPTAMIPTDRGPRISGSSSMDFVSLVGHGLSGMSVFADRIGVRLLIATVSLVFTLLATLFGTLLLRVFSYVSVPGWASISFGVLAILLVQGAMLALVFIFMIEMSRAGSSFVPARDYEVFVGSVKQLEIPDARQTAAAG